MQHDKPTPHWSDIELAVLRALSVQVKYLTVDQIARSWFTGPNKRVCDVENVLAALSDSDLVIQETFEVYDAPRPNSPLLKWQPGDPPPTLGELDKLVQTLAKRWSEKLRPATIFRASREAANCFGATTSESKDRSSDWSHDLFISEVLLRYRDARKSEVKNWFGEAFVPKLGLTIKGIKDPDAFLVVDGQIERIIEIGGKYTVEHLQALHEHCAGGAYRRLQEFSSNKGGRQALRLYDKQRIPYEIW